MGRSSLLLRVSLGFALAFVLAFVLAAPRSGFAAPTPLSDDGRAGVVTAAQGVAMVRPIGRERWTPLDTRGLLFPGDVLRTEARGANALEIRLTGGMRLVVGPGATLELPDIAELRLLRGELEVKLPPKAHTPNPPKALRVTGSGNFDANFAQAEDVERTVWLRATDTNTLELKAAPKWLEGYRANTSEEWMGSLLATVDGKNVPLTVGYHKVVVEIRDQIARTTVEESFVNSTDATLEGVFSFPLPADASISGFGMWIGDELVEADLVEKQRARAIYEDILRRKKDPGLLEWEGGNLFKARVFPIFPHSEKRIRLRYTEVLPLEGDAYRYRYALRSELLRLNPLKELSIAVNVMSAATLKDVSSPTHAVTRRKTDHEAVVEFGAQQYTPERDFELSIGVGRGEGLSALAHVRGEDGFFMLLVSPPDAAAGGWQRDLVPEGDPLDLVLVADTSGSMDPAARTTQAQFLSALLGQLSAKDRFRLIASDVEPHDLVAEATPATEENVAKALALLDARFSLGWTDLDKAFDAVFAKAGPGANVVYVGDGIPTSGDADPVATVDRLRTKARDSKAVFHAVSTSSAYEKGVLTGIASIGGGSFRRADGGAAAAAKTLLAEIARPGLRDAKLSIEGVATAKVYPEVLPNLPLGQQQVVLGRFLPGAAGGKTANVVVTGTVAGKPVKYTSSFVVPAADEGNSFLPRLWARRHLDALLAQGQSQETKDEVVAFSREYQIMTPYTSFLVLENDEDRVLYGVERTVKMRDAERFFAQARDTAALAVARKQMETAHRWRVHLRRQILADIATLGRGLPVPSAVTWGSEETWGATAVLPSGLGGGAGGELRRLATGRDYGMAGDEPDVEVYLSPSNYTPPSPLRAESGDLRTRGDVVNYEEAPEGDDSRRMSGGAIPMGAVPARNPSDPTVPQPPTTPAAVDGPYSDANADGVTDRGDEEEVAGFAAGEFDEREQASAITANWDTESALDDTRPRLGFLSSREVESGAPGRLLAVRPWRPRTWNAGELGFPDLADAPKPPSAFPEPSWDPVVLKALKSLDRRSALASMTGAVRLTVDDREVHPLDGRVESHRRTIAVVAAKRWRVASQGFLSTPIETWLSETERGVANAGLRLGRRRAATEADRAAAPPLPLADLSLIDLVRGLARAYRHAPAFTRAGDLVTLTFAPVHDPGAQHVLVIDVARGVLLETRYAIDGRTTSATRFADFVEIAGRWWATKVEGIDADGHVVVRQSLEIEALDLPTFDAATKSALDAHADVVFLGAAEPSLLEAQQAIHHGRAEFAHHLVVALDHGLRGRFDELWKAWAPAEAAVAAKPAVAWMRLSLLERSRRGEDLRTQVFKVAGDVAATDAPVARWRAAALDARASSLGIRERLSLVDAVKGVWARPGEDAELWSIHGRRREAEAAHGAGLADRGRAIRAALATERPFDVTDVLNRAERLDADGDLAGCVAYLAERATKGGPWTRDEAESLFTSWTDRLWELRDVPGLAAAADAWIAANPRCEAAYRLRWSCLYFVGRYADADRWVVEHLKADTATLDEPVAIAARTAAIQIAVGRGWNVNLQSIPSEWRPALGALALALARSDARSAGSSAWFVDDWMFQQTEEGRVFAEALQKDLTVDGAIATMPLPRLVRTVGWARRGASEATWKAIVEGLVARWRATIDEDDAERLARAVLASLPEGGRAEERIGFHQERLATAPVRRASFIARDLLGAILTAPYEAGREDEAFGLLSKSMPAGLEGEIDAEALAYARRAQVASAARRLAAWVYQGRYLTALGKPEDRSKWTRAEAVQKTKDARIRAQSETAARFATAVSLAEAVSRPWLEVERLGYAAQTLADLAKADGEARELLEAIPPAGESFDVELDALLAERAAAVVTFVATRRSAPTGLADRAVALFRARIEAKDRLLDDREAAFRLLVALDRAADLEKDLLGWVRPDEVDNRWRIAAAWLMAETNRLPEAVKTLEAAAAVGDLDAEAWGLLADGYLVAKEDARRDDALDHRLAQAPEYRLVGQLWQEQRRVEGRGEGAASALDPEILRVLRFLLRKADGPSQYLGNARSFYRSTKDFRVLECLADGVTGHSPEAVYDYLEGATVVVGEIHEEATCDALAARIASVLASPATRTAVDRRALHLLLVGVELRAGAVPKADPAHAARALVALRVAFDGAFVPGERRLLARHLASLGAAASPALADEQVARLEALLAGATEGPLERLLVGRHLAQVLWDRGRKDDATDRLVALLDATRSADGSLPTEADAESSTLISWWSEMGKFREAETRLRADLARETRSKRRDEIRLRLFTLYGAALGRLGATSLGALDDLLRAASAEMEGQMLEGPAYLVPEIVGLHGELYAAAKRSNFVPDVGGLYRAFVLERLPKADARVPMQRLDVYGRVLPRLRDLSSPLEPLAVAVDLLEREPTWFERTGVGAWEDFGGAMAGWRHEADSIGELEPRLLPIVLKRLELALMTESSDGGGFWTEGNTEFWSERKPDFAAVAARVAELEAGHPSVALRAAQYQRDGLDLHPEAIATLEMILAHGLDPEDVRSLLARWLEEDGRHAEAWPVVERLVRERPDDLDDLVLATEVLHGLGRGPDALRILSEAAARWKAQKTWTAEIAAGLAKAAVDAELPKAGAEWMDDALRMRREAGGGGREDAVLSSWCRTLARARSQLGETDAAIEAASAAIVAWGPRQDEREEALGVLSEVMAKATDLDAWVTRHDAQVAASGADAPLLRKTLGHVYLDRGRTDRAVAQLRAARDLDPVDGETHELLVRALDAASDGPGALDALLASLRMAPKNLPAYEDVAGRFAKAGDAENAERAKTSLVEAMPSEPDGYRELGQIRQVDGKWPLAVVAWRGVARTRPTDPSGWLSLAKAQLKVGDKDGARRTIDHLFATTWEERFGDLKAEAAKLLERLK